MRLLAGLMVVFLSFSLSANDKNDTIKQFEQLINNHSGKVIYVDFWASWCVPCRQSFPWMNEMQSLHQEKGFTVISVNLDAQQKNALAFLEEVPANFPVFYDPKGALTKTFKIKGMPSSFIINKEGKIVSAHVGFNAEKKVKYQEEILALLAKS